MGEPNINFSNGTCYTAAGQRLAGNFIPCGNNAFGYQTCCGAGDNCLSDLACFGIHGSGYGSYLTYFAGCTDPNYRDSSCPNKQVNQPWVALTLCDNSDGAWAICSQQGNPTTLQPGSFCSCTNSASATVAFKASNVLANVASLPQSTGQSISFFAGYSPRSSSLPTTTGANTNRPTSNTGRLSTTVPSSSASVSTLSGGSITTVFVNVTPSSGSSSAGSENGQSGSASKLGTGAIVGIAIGAVIAVLLLVILAMIFFRRRRRRSSQSIAPVDDNTKLSEQRLSDISTTAPGKAQPSIPSMPEADGAPISEMMGRPVGRWEGMSELDGTQVFPKQSEPPSHVAELPGSDFPSRQDATDRPVEEAMVAPLNLPSRDKRVR